jgi:mono/diheme cytochrome c family protein
MEGGPQDTKLCLTQQFRRRTNIMCKLSIGFTLALASLLISPALLWGADDGAALYKKRCAGCHGAGGEGKPAVKAPALKGTAMSADQVVEHLTKGEATSKAPHNKGMAGLNEGQAKAIAEFVKTL